MWLLNAHTQELEQIVDEWKLFNRYAILSHTWEEEELSFQDVRTKSGEMRSKAGYAKVDYICRQAVVDKLNYVWVDTCCIDKTSSAELSEAINSMFRWYRYAAVCYAYLSDVSGGCPPLLDVKPRVWHARTSYHGTNLPGLRESAGNQGDARAEADTIEHFSHYLRRYRSVDSPQDDDWHQMFARSRWFTRGWTLQELIAPYEVHFFGRSWNYLGRKTHLTELLVRVTGIERHVLQNSETVSACSIAQKMSWAADRSTSRLEDSAYSLLGLFGINMPMLYGEGGRAFLRLQEEIIKSSTDPSIFAWDIPRRASPNRYKPNYFAASPDDFGLCHEVIRLPESSRDASYSLSNEGLKLHVPVLIHDGTSFMILNCRYSDDFTGVLAISIIQTVDVSSVTAGASKPSRYQITPGIALADFDDLGCRGRRLSVVPVEEAMTAEQQDIVLDLRPRTKEIERDLSFQSITPAKVWIHGETITHNDWRIVTALPQALWNLSTHVMSPTYPSGFHSIIGTVTLQNAAEQFMIAFRHSIVPHHFAVIHLSGRPPVEMIEDCLRKAPGSLSRTDFFAASDLQIVDGDRPIKDATTGRGIRVNTNVSIGEIFGEEVYAMTVAIEYLDTDVA